MHCHQGFQVGVKVQVAFKAILVWGCLIQKWHPVRKQYTPSEMIAGYCYSWGNVIDVLSLVGGQMQPEKGRDRSQTGYQLPDRIFSRDIRARLLTRRTKTFWREFTSLNYLFSTLEPDWVIVACLDQLVGLTLRAGLSIYLPSSQKESIWHKLNIVKRKMRNMPEESKFFPFG
jgi:hypothetical protein